MFTARVEHDLAPGVTLRNITRWGRTKQDLTLTGVFSNAPARAEPRQSAQLVRARQSARQAPGATRSSRTRRTSRPDVTLGGLKHSFSAGVEFAREEQDNATMAAQINASNGVRSGTTFLAYNNLYAPNLNRPFVPVLPNGASTNGKVTTAALYGFDTIKLNEQWMINGGVRYEHYKHGILRPRCTRRQWDASRDLALASPTTS